jgi:hypothetical protein
MSWRSFAVFGSFSELEELKSKISVGARFSNNRGLLFVFTGQGAQYSQMGCGLTVYPVFKNTLYAANAVLKELGCQWSILGISPPFLSRNLCLLHFR